MTNENELDDLLCELSLGCGFLSYDTKVREAISLIKSQQSRIELLESAIREFLYKPDTKNSLGANVHVETLRNLMENKS